MGNKKILIAGSIILGLIAVRSWSTGKPATTPMEGGLVALVLLALLAAFGEKPALLAGNLAMLVALTTIFTTVPSIAARVQGG